MRRSFDCPRLNAASRTAHRAPVARHAASICLLNGAELYRGFKITVRRLGRECMSAAERPARQKPREKEATFIAHRGRSCQRSDRAVDRRAMSSRAGPPPRKLVPPARESARRDILRPRVSQSGHRRRFQRHPPGAQRTLRQRCESHGPWMGGGIPRPRSRFAIETRRAVGGRRTGQCRTFVEPGPP